jgi:predicted PurR-regulated permease PerM
MIYPAATGKADYMDNPTGQSSAPQKSTPHLRSVNRPGESDVLPRLSRIEITSYVLAAGALVAILGLKLLGGLLAGMLVYLLVSTAAPLVGRRAVTARARWLVIVLLAVLIVAALAGLGIAVIKHLEDTVPNIPALFDKLMQIVDQARTNVPPWIANLLPVDAEQMRLRAGGLLNAHMAMVKESGKDVARGFAHVLFGMVIGAMVAVGEVHTRERRPLSAAMAARVARFAEAFRQIVFAQFKISAINTCFTTLYLLVVLPLFHQHVPLPKTLILITFLTGLMPVIGNLISNTLIVAVSMSVGMGTALASLVFLVAIHKLEYFLNARIIGGQIEARAWELLIAMLLMDAAFGIPGAIAAPIFYAYVKRELSGLRLV